MRYLLDTNIIVGYLRDKPGKRELIKRLFTEGDLAVAIITSGELEYGARKAENYNSEKKRINQCFEDLGIEVLPLIKTTMQLYAKIKRSLEMKGSGLDDFDLLIGATAMENGITLVTDNTRHFSRISGIAILP